MVFNCDQWETEIASPVWASRSVYPAPLSGLPQTQDTSSCLRSYQHSAEHSPLDLTSLSAHFLCALSLFTSILSVQFFPSNFCSVNSGYLDFPKFLNMNSVKILLILYHIVCLPIYLHTGFPHLLHLLAEEDCSLDSECLNSGSASLTQ